MTPKEIERIQNKIKKIRQALYNEKRLFGDYHDGRGLRYAPFELYLKIPDYKGGLTYLRWFIKNFPEDIGMPDIMFMSSLIYFKNNKIKDAERRAIQTFFADSLTFDIFFNRPISINNDLNVDIDSFSRFFAVLQKQNDLTDFEYWLADFENSEIFIKIKSDYLDLKARRKNEKDKKINDKLYDKIIELQKLDNY